MAAPRYKRGGKWVRTSGDDIPARAVVAGESSAGGPLYVGRAAHEDGLFPGKVNPEHNCCYIAWGGEEHSKDEYDILVAPRNCDLTWVDASNGHIPTGAIQGGLTGIMTLSTLGGQGMRTAMPWGRSTLSMAAATFPMGERRLLRRIIRFWSLTR
eukprot:TRINITY_DN648_c0_g1_i10.p1 TRINITY_DN648_c0_g1~~TRINITY_DN648_c0_g1_i10.p1  ORF type:complete len:155 (-),score=26.34 TRINITY_DN648_c0_g1_i10:145-609(-)